MSLAAMVLADRGAPLARFYDRWIELVTLGRAARARAAVLRLISPGDRVIDLGCGTGTLAIAAAAAGAQVVGVDRSPAMLSVAAEKSTAAGVAVEWREGDLASPVVPGVPFDLVASTFALSEVSRDIAVLAIRRAAESLRPGGRLVIVDEVPPTSVWHRVLVGVPRALLAVLSFAVLEGYAPTHRHAWRALIEEAGLEVTEEHRVSSTLALLVATRPVELPPALRDVLPLSSVIPDGVRGVLVRVGAWFALPIAVAPGVYTIGSPGVESPILLTGNFLGSVTAVRRALDGVDAYLIVEDSDGWNVWCASDAGRFSAERAAALIELCDLGGRTSSRRVIVPRLGGRVARPLAAMTGWTTVIGPIEARDLPTFLTRGLEPEMRSLARMNGLRERVRVGALTAVQIPLFLLPARVLPATWRRSMLRLALVEGLVLPLAHERLPGRTGVVKGAALGVVVATAGAVTGRTGIRGALTSLVLAPVVGWIYQSTSPVVFWKRLLR
jgi:SAM-dependent methyltransferase